MNSSDCAKRILLCLSGESAGRTQAALSQELDVTAEQLGPVITGLAHNRYLSRDFNVPGILVSLTEEGRLWADRIAAGESAAAKAPSPPSKERSSSTLEGMEMPHAAKGVDMLVVTERPQKRNTSRAGSLSGGEPSPASRVVKIVRRSRRTVPAA